MVNHYLVLKLRLSNIIMIHFPAISVLKILCAVVKNDNRRWWL